MLAYNIFPPTKATMGETRQKGYVLLMPNYVPVINKSHHNQETVKQVDVFPLFDYPGFGADVYSVAQVFIPVELTQIIAA